MEMRKIHTFTFHNVSINTPVSQRHSVPLKSFTFHNVSINTQMVKDIKYMTISLYIPQCFY